MSAALDPALVERCVQLVRDLHADHVKHGVHDYVQDFVARTAAIVAELPEPVDPDLVEARELVADAVAFGYRASREPEGKIPKDFRDGTCDAGDLIRNTLAAIKRGRELQREASK